MPRRRWRTTLTPGMKDMRRTLGGTSGGGPWAGLDAPPGRYDLCRALPDGAPARGRPARANGVGARMLPWITLGLLLVVGLVSFLWPGPGHHQRSSARDPPPPPAVPASSFGVAALSPAARPDAARSAGSDPGDAAHAPFSRVDVGLPLVTRVHLAAKGGRWRDAVAWIEEELPALPAGHQVTRLATLRLHILMTNAPRSDAALALASLLANGAQVMAEVRFWESRTQDVVRNPDRATIFSDPFMVSLPEAGWKGGGACFARLMIGHAQDIDGRAAPHLRSTKTYLAYLTPFLDAAIADTGTGASSGREVLRATRDFVALNERLLSEGPAHVRTHTTHVLSRDIASFLRAHAAVPDWRVQAFCGYLVRAYPLWAAAALNPRGGD